MLRSLLIALAVFLTFSIATVMGGYFYVQHFIHTPVVRTQDQELIIPKGMGGAAIAELLAKEHIVSNALLFKVAIKTAQPQRPLIAGEYLFPKSMSPQDVLTLLASGKVIRRSLTIPEGVTATEAMAIIAQAPYLEGTLPDTKTIAEGSLLPETYLYQRGDTRAAMLERMQRDMQKTLNTIWEKRAENLPLSSAQDMLILASIVEKETGIASERPHIASVFINRLKLGMKLQSDPTTIYGIYAHTGTKPRTLSKADLLREDDYNTYVIPALPPTPIALAGKAALEAVAHPENTQDIYFVATGTGGHNFAATLEEHNKNVAHYRAQSRP
jgi:UPF0755 protein